MKSRGYRRGPQDYLAQFSGEMVVPLKAMLASLPNALDVFLMLSQDRSLFLDLNFSVCPVPATLPIDERQVPPARAIGLHAPPSWLSGECSVRQRISIHEAAHAVVALHLGFVPIRLEVNEDNRGGFCQLHAETAEPMSQAVEFERKLAILQAGSMAEFAVFGDIHSNDGAQSLWVLSEHRPEWSASRRGCALIRSAARAWRIVRRLDRRILELAGTLSEAGMIEGAQNISAAATRG